MITAALFALTYLLGCAMAIIRHPIYGLVTYIAVFYLHPPSRWWGGLLPSLRWSLLAALVTLIAVVIHKPSQNSKSAFHYSVVIGSIVFLVWIVIQSFWALHATMHADLMVLTTKYIVLIYVIYRSVDSEKHLKLFFWAHALGCFYLGTIVYTKYTGGRFEGFGGPGINESNAAALMMVTGAIVTAALFLNGRIYEKIASVGVMPFILNALVASISRSGFLALFVAGVVFNIFVPKRIANFVKILSIVGVVVFVNMASTTYWDRISTILAGGEEVEGTDTGYGRVVLINAQLEMFSAHIMGCGHRCTAVLSPLYLDDRFLAGPKQKAARSSHSTILTVLVEQGIPGIVLYVLLIVWLAFASLGLRKRMRNSTGFIPIAYAAIIAVLGAITLGDLFVDYLKFEVRFWFIGLLLVVYKLDQEGGLEPVHDGQLKQS